MFPSLGQLRGNGLFHTQLTAREAPIRAQERVQPPSLRIEFVEPNYGTLHMKLMRFSFASIARRVDDLHVFKTKVFQTFREARPESRYLCKMSAFST
jgi:hypothetical protein